MSDTHTLETSLAQAKSLIQQSRFAEAEVRARAALEMAPGDPEGLYLLAVAQRYQSKLDGAIETLNRLQQVAPDYGRAWQEEGHVRRALDDPAGAARAYREAVRLNPALEASWRAMADMHAALGQNEAAELARAQAAHLASLPKEIAAASSLMHEGKLYKAEALARAFLQQNPHHLEAMRLLAQLGLRLGVLDDAEFLLESALEFSPEFHAARYDYVQVLMRRQKFAKARDEARLLVEARPGDPAFELVLAHALAAAGEYDEALALYDRLRPGALAPEQIDMARGHALKTIGRHDEAVAAYRAAHQRRADFGDAYWSLANLKTYRFSDSELARMQEALSAASTGAADRFHLAYALGKAYEDRGEYDRSFSFYQEGAALKRAETRYDPDRMDAELQRQKTHCTRALFERFAGAGCPSPDPIFIVGLPRAGSTLIEQILASHSQVDGTLELPHVLALAHRLSGRRRIDQEPLYPANLAALSPDKLTLFGETYLRDVEVFRAGAPRFTDKMPNNFRHIGLIALMLPNARIIDARRDAMACCFSGFKQLFAEGQEFSYSLSDIGRYYRGYVDLMDHWERELPGRILRVQHEDVVGDLQGEVRRLLDFCGLPFEQACVDFHKTERAVRTASSEQVRQPIYRSGLEQWRRFEPWLGPLKEALGPDLAPEGRAA